MKPDLVQERQEAFSTAVDDAWVSVARRPVELRGGLKINNLPPRLWETLRLRLQAEYRQATGNPHATLIVEDDNG